MEPRTKLKYIYTPQPQPRSHTFSNVIVTDHWTLLSFTWIGQIRFTFNQNHSSTPQQWNQKICLEKVQSFGYSSLSF